MTHGPTRHTADATPDRTDQLVSRLEAVERTLTGTDTDVSSLEDVAAIEARLSDLESTVETLVDRMDEVDAATQAIRGYVGGVRTVNEDVERRANAALAKAEALEDALVDESALPTSVDPSTGTSVDAASPPRTDGFDTPTDHAPTTPTDPAPTTPTDPAPTTPTDSTADSRSGTRRRSRDEHSDEDARRGFTARLRDVL